ncbi:MAG: DUF1059 domain-containing protein [Candidatus Micrarchaeaceae archaeon]
MAKEMSFRCADIGMSCGFEARASQKSELMEKIAEHAKSAHNIQKIDAELKKKVEKAIKER